MAVICPVAKADAILGRIERQRLPFEEHDRSADYFLGRRISALKVPAA